MNLLTAIRKQLAYPKISWQLCLICALGSLFASATIILFISTIELIQQILHIEGENYANLPSTNRVTLPLIAVIIILFFSRLTGYKYIRSGIPFVLHRLKTSYGLIPFRNTFNQFIGSVVSLAAGFSVGREGPVVHLGAATSSFLGRYLALPYNAIRILCASGIAAGIAACFNTPIAAVIFVMEVILREYNVHMFIPIMISAIIGSSMTNAFIDSNYDLFFVGQFTLASSDMGYVILAGCIIGILASLFNRYLISIIKRFKNIHIITRFFFAAAITASLGYFIPHAMGTGLSAITLLQQDIALSLLLTLLSAKIIMTIFAIGLGVPGGIIGPILAIGAIAGAAIGVSLTGFNPDIQITTELIILAMAGFMAATLNAPLAALITVVELSHQLSIMVPAMVIITTACLIAGQLFKNQSIFIMQLNIQQLPYRRPPIENTLQNIGALSKAKHNFKFFHQPLTDAEIAAELNNYNALIIDQGETLHVSERFVLIEAQQPGSKQPLIPLTHQATLAEAYSLLHKQRIGGVMLYEDDYTQPISYVTFKQIRHYLLAGKI